MNKFICLVVICISAACTPKGYTKLMKTKAKIHPIMVHTLEYEIAQHMEDTDTNEARFARELWAGFEPAFNAYKPSKTICKKVFTSSEKRQIKFYIVGGNWCSDTREQLPKLIKTLHISAVNEANVSYFRVNKNKNLLDLSLKQPPFEINYTKVPTLFIAENNKIIGTIVETPTKTWEEDILAVLRIAK